MFKKGFFILTIFFSAVYSIPGFSKTILVVGDSISASYGLSDPKLGWVSLLENKLNAMPSQSKYTVINASISGDTTSNGKNRLPALLTEYQPDIVLIELGGNDGLRATAPVLIQQNLTEMVNQAKTSGAKVLLIGIELPPNYGATYLRKFLAVFPNVALQTQTPLLTSIVANVGQNPDLMQKDGIHPNEQAQPIITEDIYNALIRTFYLKRDFVN